ncbi:hypothetical protein N7534_005558 [Penicillium rubens]|nr:hypothetical protein N7534_005558 [Penicillium rubens]
MATVMANSNWYMDNITALCTTTCHDSFKAWGSDVEQACAGEKVVQGGVIVEAKALSLSLTYNVQIACLQDSKFNWCFFDSQSWQGSDYIRYDSLMCADESDMPDICNDEDFDIQSITADMQAMTNLYNPSMFCSECFLELYRLRLLDPWLASTNFTDYLIGQFDSVQQNCSTTLPYTMSSSTLYIGAQTSVTTTATTTDAATTINTAASTAVCLGQVVQPIANWLTCDDLSDTYNVSTGDARTATGDYDCFFDTPACLPLPCPIYTVWGSPSCTSLAELASTPPTTFPSLSIWHGTLTFKAAAAEWPTVSAFVWKPLAVHGLRHQLPLQLPQALPSYYTTATPAYPTQSGTTESCGKYYQVVSGDVCATVNLGFGLNITQLQSLNTYLDDNCSNLWLDYDVCVAPVSAPTVSSDGSCAVVHLQDNAWMTVARPEIALLALMVSVGPIIAIWLAPALDLVTAAVFSDIAAMELNSAAQETATLENVTLTTGGPSISGECGAMFVGNKTCTGTQFGDCCSVNGYCGSTNDYCSPPNCYSGACLTSGYTSTNGECGPNFANNMTCVGSLFGDCCSVAGYCGNSSGYCSGTNCYSGSCVS